MLSHDIRQLKENKKMSNSWDLYNQNTGNQRKDFAPVETI